MLNFVANTLRQQKKDRKKGKNCFWKTVSRVLCPAVDVLILLSPFLLEALIKLCNYNIYKTNYGVLNDRWMTYKVTK